MIFILGADIAIFVMLHNKDERVPAEHRITMDLSKFSEAREAKAAAKLQGKVSLVLKAPDKSTLAPPTAETPEYELRVAAEQLYIKAMQNLRVPVGLRPRAQRQGRGLRRSTSVDGVRQNLDQLSAANAQKMMDFWKSAAKLDTNERRKKQVADVSVEQDMDKKKLRLTSIGAQGGMRLTILVDPEGSVRRRPRNSASSNPRWKSSRRSSPMPRVSSSSPPPPTQAALPPSTASSRCTTPIPLTSKPSKSTSRTVSKREAEHLGSTGRRSRVLHSRPLHPPLRPAGSRCC